MMMKRQGEEGRGWCGGGRRCQDCGNQAKKDCAFMRCRTCCRAKALHCQTHIKSTWLPRPRRHQQLDLHASKRPMDIDHHISNYPPPVNFPAEVSSPATFRCVKVSPVAVGDDHHRYAYQTAVSIGGRVFKGILYDQGGEAAAGAGESWSQQPSDHIINAAAVVVGTTSSDHQTLLPASSSSYPTPFSPVHFFLHPKS